MTDDTTKQLSDQQRAFYEYKSRVAKHGKPFFPHGVYHDVIAATIVMLIIIGISTIWFAQANCDSWWNISCDRVSTPLEQEHYTPEDPGTVVRDAKGKPKSGVDGPLFGPLYEDKADPATTSYHPRPEWYFYFLFYLLIVFSNPQLVILGTIGVPTIWLILLILWPFIDRKKERRPSRRPVAMSAMVLIAAMLLTFSYLGSQQGKETGGPEGLADEQIAMPGYKVLFEDGVFETCASCHKLANAGSGNLGPNLEDVGTRYESVDDLIDIMANGKGNGAMPVKGQADITDEEAAQIAAFLATLGKASEAEKLSDIGQADWDRVVSDS